MPFLLMFRFFYGSMISGKGKKIGVDDTLTFGPEGHFQGHKVCIVTKTPSFSFSLT